jgi:hypothetical protein
MMKTRSFLSGAWPGPAGRQERKDYDKSKKTSTAAHWIGAPWYGLPCSSTTAPVIVGAVNVVARIASNQELA